MQNIQNRSLTPGGYAGGFRSSFNGDKIKVINNSKMISGAGTRIMSPTNASSNKVSNTFGRKMTSNSGHKAYAHLSGAETHM